MAKRSKEILTQSFIVVDGECVEFCALPQEKREELWGKMMDNASYHFSKYLSTHSEDAKRIKELCEDVRTS